MVTIALVLLIAAFLVFALAAFGWAVSAKVNMVALGLALWVLSTLIDKIKF